MSSPVHIPPELITDAQKHLERAQTLGHIIVQVRGKAPATMPHIGRYHFLWQALMADPSDKPILSVSGKPFETWWDSWSKAHVQDKTQGAAFLHGLNLMHWEWALEGDAEGDVALAGRHYVLAGYYWRQLLARGEYWESFSAAQRHPQGASFGQKLRERIGQMIINHHFEAFKFAYRSGGAPQMLKTHLQGLYPWTENPKPSMLKSAISGFKGDQELLRALDVYSESLFKEWLQSFLDEARKILDDPNHLSAGMRKNYDGAIKSLDPVLHLAPHNPRLFKDALLFVVEQVNQWGQDYLMQEDETHAEQLVNRYATWVDLLASICTPPAPNMPVLGDADTLATSYLFRARMSSDVEKGAEAAREALRWNRHAPDLEFQVQVQAILREADQLTHTFLNFQGRRDILEMDTQITRIIELLTNARNLTAEACRRDPANFVIRDNLTQLEREIKERPNYLRAHAVRSMFGRRY